MMDFLQQLAFWDWLAIATALLVIEVFGARGYAMWAGVCALAISLICFFLPALNWLIQISLFIVLGALAAWVWHVHQHPQTR